MDYIDAFDIDLEREFSYPGDTLHGNIIVSSTDNVKIRGITIVLRGRVQVQWKVVKNGAVYTVRNCRILLDQKSLVWGSDADGDLPVLRKGTHKIKFSFHIDEGVDLPSSFESKLGSVRYLLHANVDIPYASPPQCVKHITIIRKPDQQPPSEWLVPLTLIRNRQSFCTACSQGPLIFEMSLTRTAFCCGENIPLRLEVINGLGFKVWPLIQLKQKVTYFVDRTGLGIKKEITHIVWEYKGPLVPKHSTMKLDNLSQVLQVPVMPPSISSELCDIIQIEYNLKLCLTTQKWGEPLSTIIPVLITSYHQNEGIEKTTLKKAISSIEGGNYISPELQVGQVYDGSTEFEATVIYQPLYVSVPPKTSTKHASPTTMRSSAQRRDTENNDHNEAKSIKLTSL